MLAQVGAFVRQASGQEKSRRAIFRLRLAPRRSTTSGVHTSEESMSEMQRLEQEFEAAREIARVKIAEADDAKQVAQRAYEALHEARAVAEATREDAELGGSVRVPGQAGCYRAVLGEGGYYVVYVADAGYVMMTHYHPLRKLEALAELRAQPAYAALAQARRQRARETNEAARAAKRAG